MCKAQRMKYNKHLYFTPQFKEQNITRNSEVYSASLLPVRAPPNSLPSLTRK